MKPIKLERVIYRIDEGDGIARDDGDVIEIPRERRVDLREERIDVRVEKGKSHHRLRVTH